MADVVTAVEPAQERDNQGDAYDAWADEQQALAYQAYVDAQQELAYRARACPHDSHSGADEGDLLDPEKVWRCDHCGHERVGPR